MTRLPRTRDKQLVTAMSQVGFETVRTRGSHHFMYHSDRRTTVEPVHGNEKLGLGLLSKTIGDCDLTREQLTDLL